jgi:hypothetical protein
MFGSPRQQLNFFPLLFWWVIPGLRVPSKLITVWNVFRRLLGNGVVGGGDSFSQFGIADPSGDSNLILNNLREFR